ncbi:hypothetical protein BC829DRAFT_381349 [Chytridium lagenaria]|nr:hypothetical protein BC829DRAFT_381349 [Chytridium lagenaria]
MASMSSLRQLVEKVKAPSPHESFSNLFRNSKLASVTYPVPAPSTLQPQRAGAFTSNTTPPFASLSLSGYQMLPTGEQPILPHHVITTSPDLKLKGEWGLKRSLPRDLNASNVIVTRLDHHSLGSRGTYRTASREVNQPYRSVHPPFYLVSPLPDENLMSVVVLTVALSTTASCHLVQTNFLVNSVAFTDAVFGSDTPNRPSTASVVKPETISTSIYNTNLPTDLRDIPTLAPLPVSGKPPLPLLKNRIMVRYLNSVMHGHAVSVLGLVGFVPEREAGDFLEMSFGGGSSSNVMDRAPLVAHVLNASFEADGTPVISLSLKHSAVEEAVKKTGSFYSRSAGSPASIMAKASKAPRSPVGGKKRNVDAVSSASLMGSSPSAVGTELLSDALEGRTGLTGRFVETPLIPRNSGSKRRQASEPAWSPLTAMKSAEAAASAEGTVGAKLNLPETAKVMKLFDGPEATAKRDRKAPASRGATSPRPKSE